MCVCVCVCVCVYERKGHRKLFDPSLKSRFLCIAALRRYKSSRLKQLATMERQMRQKARSVRPLAEVDFVTEIRIHNIENPFRNRFCDRFGNRFCDRFGNRFCDRFGNRFCDRFGNRFYDRS